MSSDRRSSDVEEIALPASTENSPRGRNSFTSDDNPVYVPSPRTPRHAADAAPAMTLPSETKQSGNDDYAVQPNDQSSGRSIKRYSLRDLEDSAFLLLRRLYHIYFLILAGVFLFVVGLNTMMHVLFSLFLPRVTSGRTFFFTAFGLVCLILLLAYFVASIITSCYMLILDAWSVDEFIFYRRIVTFDNGVAARETKPGSKRAIIDHILQILIILSFDVLPFVMAAVFGYIDGSTNGLIAFFLTGMLVAAFHTLDLWFFALVKDYYDKVVDLIRIFKDPEVSAHIESFINNRLLMFMYGSQDLDEEQQKRAKNVAITPGITMDKTVEATPSQNVPKAAFASSNNIQPLQRASEQKNGDFPNYGTVRPVASTYSSKGRDSDDKLNICVSLGVLMNKAANSFLFKCLIAAGLIVGVVLGILFQQTFVFLVCIALLLIGFCIALLSFIVSHAPKTKDDHGGPVFQALSIFFHKHCGVQRFLMLRFSILVFILAIMLSLVLVYGKMWIALIITGLLGLFVLIIAVVAFTAPNFLFIVVLSQCIFFFFTSIINNFVVFGPLVGAMTVVLIFATQVFLTRKFRSSFTVLSVVLFVFLGFALVIFSIGYYASASSASRDESGPLKFPTVGYKPYQFCSNTWGGSNVVDYAMLAKLAYDKDEIFESNFRAWFPVSTGWNKTYSYSESGSVTFHRFDNSITNNTVISVRGTASGSDVLQDVDIWMAVLLFQGASMVGPSFLQPSLIDVLYYSNFVETVLDTGDDVKYYSELNKYVSSVVASKPKSKVFVTGHSLGGGLSKIVGAKQDITAVTFSAPGLYYTSKTVGVDLATLRRTGVTIKPMKDVVPRVDDQAATVYQTDCELDVASCHFITSTLCELMHACGDSSQRGVRYDTCSPALRPQ